MPRTEVEVTPEAERKAEADLDAKILQSAWLQ
jgi:hypothetical protein